MALITCKNCGKEVSDKANSCPNCGTVLAKEKDQDLSKVTCQECGKSFDSGSSFCPYCGCPVNCEDVEHEDEKNNELDNALSSTVPTIMDEEPKHTKPKMSKKKKILLIIGGILLAIIIFFIALVDYYQEPKNAIKGYWSATLKYNDLSLETVHQFGNDGYFCTYFFLGDETTQNEGTYSIDGNQLTTTYEGAKSGKTYTISFDENGNLLIDDATYTYITKKDLESKLQSNNSTKTNSQTSSSQKATTLSQDEWRNQATSITYDELARYPDNYKGSKITLSGKIIQVLEGDSSVNYRMAVNDDYDTVVLIVASSNKNSSGARILEDDHCAVYGTYNGLTSYKATSGTTITIPYINAAFLD